MESQCFETITLALVFCSYAVADDGMRQCDRVFNALKPISSVTANIRPSEGALPEQTLLPADHALPERYLGMTFCWQATNVSYAPLAFEEYNLERHGHSLGCLQPAVSGVHFLGSVATLPLTAVFCHDREYELGHTRPGSCAPFVVRYDGKRAGTAALATAVLLIP